MLTSQSTNIIREINQLGPIANGFARTRKLAITAGYIAFTGILIVCLALWLFLWHNTRLDNSTVFQICGGIVTALGFYIYTHMRRGFGTFFILLTIISIVAIFASNSTLSSFCTQPFNSVALLINIGFFLYGIISRSVIGSIFVALFNISYFTFFESHPGFLSVWFLAVFGATLILFACISRYFITLNFY